jgi:NTP pyrophosphatase (non-canonical NTP hydrolase)
MDFNEYQAKAKETAVYPRVQHMPFAYPTVGLSGEVGEVSEKIKKLWRDKGSVVTDEFLEDIKKELGDVLWYLSALSSDLGLSLNDVAETNIAKLKRRVENGTVNGNGDNR